MESGAEGMFSKEDEVVTRQPYGNVRLDHLLSKECNEERSKVCSAFYFFAD